MWKNINKNGPRRELKGCTGEKVRVKNGKGGMKIPTANDNPTRQTSQNM
jgi:hypothetical protein